MSQESNNYQRTLRKALLTLTGYRRLSRFFKSPLSARASEEVIHIGNAPQIEQSLTVHTHCHHFAVHRPHRLDSAVTTCVSDEPKVSFC